MGGLGEARPKYEESEVPEVGDSRNWKSGHEVFPRKAEISQERELPVPRPAMNASALDAPRHIHIKTNIRNRVKQRSPRKKAGIVKSVKKARSSGTCLSMLSWGMTVWLIQFWLALSSLVALGATGALAAISENALGEIVVRGTSLVFDTVLAAASFALGYSVSFDMFEAIPLLFMLTLLLTWMVGLATLMAVGLQATLAGLRPMSGNGVGLKTGAILLALIGYFIPFANLFPWFVFWVLAIWRYPN